ncbi:MAG: cysteine desulfurase family protein [Polyangiaceae bacterium]
MRDPIYLDHNATTPLLSEALDAMLPYLRGKYGNPSSQHAYGRAAKEAVETARAQVAAFLGAQPEEIVFTSCGTESNNLAIRGAVEARPERTHLVTSNVEHPAVANVCAMLERRGHRVTRAKVGPSGRVTAEDVVAAFADDTLLVSVMHANNETGAIQPVAEIGRAAREKGILVHTDAAQSAGKVPVDVGELSVDLLTLAAHKLYGPKGVGALYIRKGVKIAPFAIGAGHERGMRPGTENVASLVGFGVACAAAQRDAEWLHELLGFLRDRLWNKLRELVPGVALNGGEDPRVPSTLNVRFPKVAGPALLAATPEIAASTGAACHDGADVASAGILALGVPAEEAIGSVRFSVGRATQDAEIDRAAEAIAASWRRLTGEPRGE